MSLHATPIKQRPAGAEKSRHLFWAAQIHIERQFAVLLTFISRFFGATKIRITSEGDLALDDIVQRDSTGRVMSIALPQRSALMANHQVYLDWLYCWILLYNASLHGALTIILKASLKWAPVVGPAMQLFGFIFLTRKWEDDRLVLSAKLLAMARKAKDKASPLVLLIFPEGTLISKDTRPLSKKFADKAGLQDLRHTLRALLHPNFKILAKGIPGLKLIDATIAYPGIPSGGYGQDYYTLQSVFGANVPPPLVHIHLRQFDINRQVPIGNIDVAKGAVGAAETSAEERNAFDSWLRARWQEKDNMLERFLGEGRLVPQTVKFVDLDVAPRRDGDIVVLLGTMLVSAVQQIRCYAPTDKSVRVFRETNDD